MFGALAYLKLLSLRNGLVYRIRRLRQPRYLFGLLVALAYFYFYLGRLVRPMRSSSVQASGAGQILVILTCAAMCASALIAVAFQWISPPEKPGIQFTEAEIAFLFPAPITRNALIHFRLLSSQLAVLFTSLLMAIVYNRFTHAGSNYLTRILGIWIVLSAFSLSIVGTQLTLARLKEHSRRFLLWRIAVVSAIVAYAAAVVVAVLWTLKTALGGDSIPGGELQAIVPRLDHALAVHALILPFALLFAPLFAASPGAFALALVPALAILVLEYVWAASTDARFEEGSIAIAEKRAAIKSAVLRGETPSLLRSRLKAREGPFPLAPSGPPETAFLWKNLLSLRSSLINRKALIRSFVLVAILAFGVRSGMARASGAEAYSVLVVALCAMGVFYTLLIGPQLARQDLRNDLPNIEMLKALPVEGWRLVLGELLAPTAILTAILWVFILVLSFSLDSRGQIGWLTPDVRVAAAVSLAAAAPVLCALQLVVPNLLMVLFPGWYQASRTRGAGIEHMGQRIILSLAQLLVSLVVAAPTAAVAGLIIFSGTHLIGLAASILVATAVALAIMAGEVAVGLWCVGDRFEKFDLSTESR